MVTGVVSQVLPKLLFQQIDWLLLLHDYPSHANCGRPVAAKYLVGG